MNARALPLASIGVVGLLAWAWFVQVGRGMSMHAAMPGMQMSFGMLATMWAAMMGAMMVPAAAPSYLLHAKMSKRPLASGAYLAGYGLSAAIEHAFYCGMPPAQSDIRTALRASPDVEWIELASADSDEARARCADFMAYMTAPGGIVAAIGTRSGCARGLHQASFRSHSRALRTICSRLSRRGTQPKTRRMRSLSATRRAGSPARRGP